MYMCVCVCLRLGESVDIPEFLLQKVYFPPAA